MRRRRELEDQGNRVAYEVLEEEGNGPLVVCVPGFARGPDDFTEHLGSTLSARLVAAGYRVALPGPRGRAAPPPIQVTIEEIAADVGAVIGREGAGVVPDARHRGRL